LFIGIPFQVWQLCECRYTLHICVLIFQVGKENVHSALSLIEYDPQLHPAMQWVFGQTFICKDMETAKKVTFHERILKKSVTLDGDVFDPSGTLSGGKYLTSPFRLCLE
jgi:chromosome segregation ATPase